MSLRVTIPPGASTPTAPSALALSQHIITSNFTVTDGYTADVVRYIEIADGITLEIGDDADLEIT